METLAQNKLIDHEVFQIEQVRNKSSILIIKTYYSLCLRHITF